MIEDSWGEGTWRQDWRALTWRRRRALLAELRRGEVVRSPERALLVVRAARRLRRRLVAQTLAGAVAVALLGLLGPLLLGRIAPVGQLAAALADVSVGGWVAVSALVGIRLRAERRALGHGIAVNLDGLAHWVQHGRAPDLGPPSPREAALLMKLIEDEGWTRPHR